MKTILVIAAHPDDETLGCGGTIARLGDAGAAVHVAFLADGVSSRGRDIRLQQAELAARRTAAQMACEILGVKTVFFGEFPDNRMDSISLLEIVQPIEALIAKYQPDTVLTHHAGDVNIDHQRAHEAAVVACRPQGDNPAKTVLYFEVPSSTEWQFDGRALAFVPNWFVDISDTIDRKLAALDSYAHELRPWPHPRSRQGVEHLARWRGATVGVSAAESFALGRHVA